MTTGTPLDDMYFEWLYRIIGTITNRNPSKNHWNLARKLYKTKFLYFIPNDENRAWDGKDLRESFLDDVPTAYSDPEWLNQECSMLEMLIALSARADFLADEGTIRGGLAGWFWKILSNVGLDQYTDDKYNNRSLEEIERTLDVINNRTYSRNGSGGLFPHRNSRVNQRRVELWYQLNSYLLENEYVNPIPDA